ILLRTLQLLGNAIVSRTQLEPFLGLKLVKDGVGQLGATLQAGTTVNLFAHQHFAQTLKNVLLENAVLVLQVLAELVQLGLLDLACTLIFLDAITGEYLDIDNGALDARRNAQGGVLHVRRLLAENGTQQLFFRCQLGLALWRYLADQDVARLNLCADVNDA